MEQSLILLFSILIVAAVFSTKLSSRFGLPVLIAFIGIGILVGSDLLNLFYFDDASLTKRIADLLLVFILFDGGFRTTRRELKAVAGPSLSHATAGVALTALVLGLLIHFIAGFDLPRSLMIASIISSTDAAAVMLITRQHPIEGRLASTLNVESAANDPMAILLTLAFVGSLAGGSRGPALVALDLAWQFSGGLLVGFLVAEASAFLFDRLDSENRGYYYVLIVGLVLLAYGLAGLARANGIIAVFFMGYRLGNAEFAGKRGVSNFLEGIAAFGNVALFLMLGLLAFPSKFAGVWKEGVAIAAIMILVARPLAVLACTLPFRYSLKERLFLSWGGIKGAVPIVLATYPAASGLDPEGRVFNIIFFAVLISCLFQGTTLAPLARLLKLTVPARPRPPYSVELHTIRKSELDMFEIAVAAGSEADGSRIKDLGLAGDTLVSSIVRKDRIIPPRGDTIVLAGDVLFVLASTARIDAISEALNAPRRILSEREAVEAEIESRR